MLPIQKIRVPKRVKQQTAIKRKATIFCLPTNYLPPHTTKTTKTAHMIERARVTTKTNRRQAGPMGGVERFTQLSFVNVC